MKLVVDTSKVYHIRQIIVNNKLQNIFVVLVPVVHVYTGYTALYYM